MSSPGRNPVGDAPSNAVQATNDYISSQGAPPQQDLWRLNEKIKTCKCETCGDRVKKHSQQCTKCTRHVCSECQDPNSSKGERSKAFARDHLANGCWCKWRSNMNPVFRNWSAQPPKRIEEERVSKAAKDLGTSNRRAREAKDLRKADAIPSASAPPVMADAAGYLDHDATPAPALLVSTISATKHPGRHGTDKQSRAKQTPRMQNKRKRNAHTEHGDNVFTELDDKERAKRVELASNLPLRRSVAPPSTTLPTEDHSRTMQMPTEDLPRVASPTKRDIVILGAGVIGMFLARELALELHCKGIPRSITVVDIREGPCQLASGMCSGLLTTRDMPDGAKPLSDLAVSRWRELISSAAFRQGSGFDRSSAHVVSPWTANSQDTSGKTIPWLELKSGDSVEEDFDSLGRVDPSKLSSWLFDECQRLDAQFRFKHGIKSIDRGTGTTRITLGHRDTAESSAPLPCSDLIFAAGPWATNEFYFLLRPPTLRLENHVKGCHWLSVANSSLQALDDSAVVLTGVRAQNESMEDTISVSSRANAQNLTVSGVRKECKDLRLKPGLGLQPHGGRTRQLRDLVSSRLNSGGLDVTDKEQSPFQGRSEISTATGGLPIIDRVPVASLERADRRRAPISCNVWLSYGFGTHGTMLAPAAATLLARKMLGDELGIDDARIRVPADEQPAAMGEGKGKERAW